MSVRLLSFLSEIQAALVRQDGPVFEAKPVRTVNYRAGIARMTFADGTGSIVVQNFFLSNGVVCLRVGLEWAHATVPEIVSVYPKGENYSWTDAADRVAETWLAGPPKVLVAPRSVAASQVVAAMAATG